MDEASVCANRVGAAACNHAVAGHRPRHLSHRSNRKCVGKHTDERKGKRQDAGSGICTMESSVHGSAHRLSYRVVEDDSRWHWEVVGANRDVVACGSAQSSVKARAAAMAAALVPIQQVPIQVE